MIESRISEDGTTKLPEAVLEALGIKPGDLVRYAIFDDKVMMMPVGPVSRLFGALKYYGPPKTLEDMDRAIVEGPIQSAVGSCRSDDGANRS